MQNPIKQCVVCGRPTNQCCSKCQKTFYCTRNHQQQHWSQHKFECQGRNKNILTPVNGQNKWVQNTLKNNNNESQKYFGDRISNQKITIKDEQDYINEKQKIEDNNLNVMVQKFIEFYEIRKQERKKLIFEYVKGRQQMMINKCKNLLAISKKISQDYKNQINKKLFLTFKIHSSKLIQNLQYLMDICYVGKIYLKLQQRSKLKQLLFDLNLPPIPTKIQVYNNISQVQLEKYRTWKIQIQQYKTCLSLLASISNAGGFTSYTQNIYKQYIILVQQSYGINQQFLSYYMVALWYVQIREYQKSKKCFQHCIYLKRNADSQISVSDCYYNIALNLRMIGQIQQSIDKMHNALIIRRQKLGKSSIQASDCLQFIGRQFIELQNFSQSIDYLNECYSIRKNLLKQDDKSFIEITELIKKLYAYIKNKKKAEQRKINVSEVEQLQSVMQKIQNQSELVRDNEHYLKRIQIDKKTVKKLKNIQIDPQWFQTMDYSDLQSLTKIMQNCENLPFQQAIIYVLQSSFYKNMNQQRKSRFKQLNPDFK